MSKLKQLVTQEITQTIETMSSLKIVELINLERNLRSGTKPLRHDHFMEKVPMVIGAASAPNFRDTYTNKQNKQSYPCYKLPRRETMLMLMSYSYDLQAAVYDRMEELERQAMPEIPQTYAAALLEAGRLAQINEQQSKQLEESKPKVEFVDNYVETEGLSTFRQVAKLLEIKEPKLRSFLTDNKIMYQLNKIWTPYEPHIKAGRFAARETVNKKQNKKYTQFLFTSKGVNWIADLINQNGGANG